MPVFTMVDEMYKPIRYRLVYKCKYCKGTNLKLSSKGHWCCDCKKSSDYTEKVYR